MTWFFCGVVTLLFSHLNAASIQPLGYIGNSGQEGKSLLKVFPADGNFGVSGILVDGSYTLWIGGGKVINRVTLTGELLESFPLQPDGSLVESKTFTAMDDVLYFIGRVPLSNEMRLFALPMKSGSSATPLPFKLGISPHLAPQTIDGKLFIAQYSKDLPQGYLGIYSYSPKHSSGLALLFTLPVNGMCGMSVYKEDGKVLIYIAHYSVDQNNRSSYTITGFDLEGRLLNGYPLKFYSWKYRAIRGDLYLIEDRFWLKSFPEIRLVNLKGEDAPGIVTNYYWELGDNKGQILEVARNAQLQLLAISTGRPDAFYIAQWNKKRNEFRLHRRIGCLPEIKSLGISEENKVTVGTGRVQLWYSWDDSGDSIPYNTQRPSALCQGFFVNSNYFSLYNQKIPAIFPSIPKERNLPVPAGTSVSVKEPVSISLCQLSDKGQYLLMTDAQSKTIWHSRFGLPGNNKGLFNYNWQPITLKGIKLIQPTDIHGLPDGRIIVADYGRILMLKPENGGYVVLTEFFGGDNSELRLGKRLRFAIDGQWMLISDTDRHRVMWVKWTDWQIISVFGKTDFPGSGQEELNFPTLVALKGVKGVIADTGNQRIVKVLLNP
ncbi:MAG: hypothetical protein NC906_01440 [Candidatus Omnitrophica bacterium]|nr:hypothetical protein [Candidatus Omnitrophota bacterium]